MHLGLRRALLVLFSNDARWGTRYWLMEWLFLGTIGVFYFHDEVGVRSGIVLWLRGVRTFACGSACKLPQRGLLSMLWMEQIFSGFGVMIVVLKWVICSGSMSIHRYLDALTIIRVAAKNKQIKQITNRVVLIGQSKIIIWMTTFGRRLDLSFLQLEIEPKCFIINLISKL